MTEPVETWTGELIAPPLSGSIEETQFGSGTPGGPWTWARFEDSQGSSRWAGCFQCGDRGFDWVGVIADSSDALVVAGGEGYWVSLRERFVRYREENIVAAAAVPGVARIVVANDQAVSLLSPQGVVWRTDDIAIDGIRFTTITRDLVCGEADVPKGWAAFEIDAATGATRGGLEW